MNRIKELRKRHSLSQKDLAEKLNITQATISNYEVGKNIPDAETLKTLANLFDVSIDYIMDTDSSNGVTYPQKYLEVSDDEVALVKKYRKTSPSIQEAIKKLLDLS